MSRHEVHAEIAVRAKPHHVFHVLSDTARIAEWMPNVTNAKNDGAKKGVGAERIVELRLHNHEITSVQRITAHSVGRQFAWEHVEDTVDGKRFDMIHDIGSRFELAPDGAGTKVVAVAHFTPKGIRARLAVPLISHEIKKEMRSALENLKRLAEN